MENESQEWWVIHLLEFVISHNQSTHEQNLRSMDDSMPPWIKIYNVVKKILLFLDERLMTRLVEVQAASVDKKKPKD